MRDKICAEVKYNTLLNAVMHVARFSEITGKLYMVNDEDVYAVVQALEPERYEARCKELNG